VCADYSAREIGYCGPTVCAMSAIGGRTHRFAGNNASLPQYAGGMWSLPIS
jgi:hypothetical protein